MAHDLKEQHRSVFNRNTFGIDNNGNIIGECKVPKTEPKCLTKETWLEIVRILSMWKDADDLSRLNSDEVKQHNKYKKAHLEDWRRDKKFFYCSKPIYALEDGQL